jgi:hypothetical protein
MKHDGFHILARRAIVCDENGRAVFELVRRHGAVASAVPCAFDLKPPRPASRRHGRSMEHRSANRAVGESGKNGNAAETDAGNHAQGCLVAWNAGAG